MRSLLIYFFYDWAKTVSSNLSCISIEGEHRVFWLVFLFKRNMCHRNCLQTEPISCCFNTKEILLIQQHKAVPNTQQSDEGHSDSGIKSTIHGIDIKLFMYSLNANWSQWSQQLHRGPTDSVVLQFYLNCVIAPLRVVFNSTMF